MATQSLTDAWVKVTTTATDVLFSVRGDAEVYTVASAGTAPTATDTGHLFQGGQAIVVPVNHDIYARATGGNSLAIYTAFGP